MVALALYFIPFFHPGRLVLPFFVLLVISYIETPAIFFAVLLAALFYLMLLIKELLLINRREAHELLIFGLVFLILRDFYLQFGQAMTPGALLLSFCTAILVTALVRNYASVIQGRELPRPTNFRSAIWLSCVLVWELMIAGLFLPLDFIYQSVIVFLPILLVIDLLPDHLSGGLSRSKVMSSVAMVFILLVLVIASARWTL